MPNVTIQNNETKHIKYPRKNLNVDAILETESKGVERTFMNKLPGGNMPIRMNKHSKTTGTEGHKERINFYVNLVAESEHFERSSIKKPNLNKVICHKERIKLK
jgi:hypothetical protein